jgi:iron complex transport system ATP-binding protein
MTSIQARNIDLSYKRRGTALQVLSDLSFDVQSGNLVALIGANGSGKSSLLRIIGGLQKPTHGNIFWDNQLVEEIPFSSRSKSAAFLFSDYARVQGMSAYEVVSLGRLPYTNWLGKLSEKDHSIISDSMKQIGIDELAEEPVSSLSDGEFRKVLLAKILAQQTPVVLLDEPTTHLDLKSSLAMVLLLKKLAKEHSKIVLFSSHNLQLALKYSDKVIVLDTQGQHSIGTPEEIFETPIFSSVIDSEQVKFENGNFNFK